MTIIKEIEIFCGSTFWDSAVSWNTSSPRLSPCFQKTVLIWVPCGFFWLTAPLEAAFILLAKPKLLLSWNLLSFTKLVLTSILIFICFLSLVHSVYLWRQPVLHQSVSPADFYGHLLMLLSMILAFSLILFCHARGSNTSATLFFYWFLLSFSRLLAFAEQSFSTSLVDEYELATTAILVPLVSLQFVLAWRSDGKPLQPKENVQTKECPEVYASFPSKILFWWFNGIVMKGWRQPLTLADLWDLQPSLSANVVSRHFDQVWGKEVANTHKRARKSLSSSSSTILLPGSDREISPSLMRALVMAFGPSFFLGSILKLLYDCLQFVNPTLLRILIQLVETRGSPAWQGALVAGLLLLNSTTQSIVISYYFQQMYLVSIRMRAALVSAVYKKSLTLSNDARRRTTLGEMVNLMSVDIQRCSDLLVYLNLVWSAPLQILLAIYFLYAILGIAVGGGLLVMLVTLPVNGLVLHQAKSLQMGQMDLKDQRIRLMNEILSGMKTIKLFAWEHIFENKVNDLRRGEVNFLKRMSYINSFSNFFWTATPFLVSLCTFSAYLLLDKSHRMDATHAFVSLALFNILRFPLSMLPLLISMIVQARVSVERMSTFLGSGDAEEYLRPERYQPSFPLYILNGSFKWGECGTTVLSDVSLGVTQGEMLMILGSVGSGKSSLLAALLGQIDRVEGSVYCHGSVAYLPQQVWLMNASLRDNILFFRPYDEFRYQATVRACALTHDLAQMPAGDLTLYGDKGVNLSGGQRQRIGLARAVYQNADVYLLDDPFSAVDPQVSQHIFHHVLGPSGLLRMKTRVVVTHGLMHLPHADRIVFLHGGKIQESGTFGELLARKGALAEFLLHCISDMASRNAVTDDIDVLEDIVSKLSSEYRSPSASYLRSSPRGSLKDPVQRIRSISQQLSRNTVLHEIISRNSFLAESKSVTQASESSFRDVAEEVPLLEETPHTGKVKMITYLAYFKAMGYGSVAGIYVAYAGLQLFALAANAWLSRWSSDPDTSGTSYRLSVYGLLGLGEGLSVLLASLLLVGASTRASRLVHAALLGRVLRCPLPWFEATSRGQVLSRFARDLDTVDTAIPVTFRSWLVCVLQVLATLALISFQTPIFLVVTGPLALLYYLVQRLYVASARQLKRLDSTSKSPILSHFSETLLGLATVRAFRVQPHLLQHFHQLVDRNHSCVYPSLIANRWLAIRLELCGNCIVFFAALFAVVEQGRLTPGQIGLAISYALTVTATLNWMVRMSSELENDIVGLERILEYQVLPVEDPWELKEDAITLGNVEWPGRGEIRFEELSARHRTDGEPALVKLTAHVAAGEKVGIVGRTGAGKSSLASALFRVLEVTGGAVVLDGVDIGRLGLHTLRSRLTAIPQEPFIFAGPLRLNLDPAERWHDSQLWRVLELAHLRPLVLTLPHQLDFNMAEGGENLSLGQRQLVCLARALLHKTRVLVLDEATACVDVETDSLMRSTIRRQFADCTVLTISHRISTIIDSDRVMVLENGRLVEFDKPEFLMRYPDSVFSALARDAGLM